MLAQERDFIPLTPALHTVIITTSTSTSTKPTEGAALFAPLCLSGAHDAVASLAPRGPRYQSGLPRLLGPRATAEADRLHRRTCTWSLFAIELAHCTVSLRVVVMDSEQLYITDFIRPISS